MSVIGHQKKHVIEENEHVEKSGKYSSWKGDNNIVMSWIMNSVQPQIASTIVYYTSAKQMWDFLKQTYSNDRNVSKILQVEEELLNLQQGDQSLAQYFASLKSISERLKALRPSCPTCYKTHGEQSMVAKFLQGLSSEYAVAKAQMLTGAEIPDLVDAYNRLSRLAVTLSSYSSDIHASALAAAGGRGRGLFRGRLKRHGPWVRRRSREISMHLLWENRNVTSKPGKNPLQSSIGAAQAASSVVDESLSSSQPETVTVSINKSDRMHDSDVAILEKVYDYFEKDEDLRWAGVGPDPDPNSRREEEPDASSLLLSVSSPLPSAEPPSSSFSHLSSIRATKKQVATTEVEDGARLCPLEPSLLSSFFCPLPSPSPSFAAFSTLCVTLVSLGRSGRDPDPQLTHGRARRVSPRRRLTLLPLSLPFLSPGEKKETEVEQSTAATEVDQTTAAVEQTAAATRAVAATTHGLGTCPSPHSSELEALEVLTTVHRARPVDLEFVARGVLKSFVSAPQVLADPRQQVEQMASLTSCWGGVSSSPASRRRLSGASRRLIGVSCRRPLLHRPLLPVPARRLSIHRLSAAVAPSVAPCCPFLPVSSLPLTPTVPLVASSRDACRLSAASHLPAATPPPPVAASSQSSLSAVASSQSSPLCCRLSAVASSQSPPLYSHFSVAFAQRYLSPCAAGLTTLHAAFFSASSVVALLTAGASGISFFAFLRQRISDRSPS
ncbi:hypothetical protein EJ110_NYTH50435 [Nymphaea thermarum]|nr:hypothetical protein EJ110_NYTH50435 [Nymphaea thermarum]